MLLVGVQLVHRRFDLVHECPYGVNLAAQLFAAISNPMLKGLHFEVASSELRTHHLQQLVEFGIGLAKLCLDSS